MEDTKVETKAEEKKFSVIDMLDSIEKVFGAQHGRVVKEFNHHCEKSMRVVPIVAALITIESHKLLKEMRDILLDIKANGENVTMEEERKTGKKKIDLK